MRSNVAFVQAYHATCFGHPYEADGGRFGPFHFDCSGSIVAAYRACGAGEPKAYVSSEQFRWCRDEGSLVPWWAPFTAGELLFMPDDPLKGLLSAGHVAGVDLDTRMTIEARGHKYGCGSWPINTRHWAPVRGRLPGIDYAGAAVGPARKDDDMKGILIKPDAGPGADTVHLQVGVTRCALPKPLYDEIMAIERFYPGSMLIDGAVHPVKADQFAAMVEIPYGHRLASV